MIPKIMWGPGLSNALYFATLLDNAVAYSEPREGSTWHQAPSGEEDAWLEGGGAHDQILEGDATNIPTTDNSDTGVLASGWDGPTGWRAFLEWARAKNPFDFYSDRDGVAKNSSYLVEPLRGAPPIDDNGLRALRLKLRSATDTPFTGY